MKAHLLKSSGGLVLEDVTPRQLRALRDATGLPLKTRLSCDGKRALTSASLGQDVILIYMATDDELQLGFDFGGDHGK